MISGTTLGLVAALGTAIGWTGTALFFSASGRRVGSEAVNLTRLLIAIALLGAAHWLLVGAPVPIDADAERWRWLAVSGLTGLVVGDIALFEAYVLLGPRLPSLLMALAPILGTLFSWGLLGERLALLQVAAIVLTVGGVAIVVAERTPGGRGADDARLFTRGVVLGLVGALGQAAGLVASKRAMAGDYSALSATLGRILIAAIVLWLLALIRGRIPHVVRAWRDRRALALIAAGAVCGPFIGIWLSLYAVREAPVGLASAVMAISPILVLAVEAARGRHVTGQAVVGTAVAVGGVALLFAVG
ncbi:MAG: DMT family transporter [Ardenticatenales bacterium]|nr:DMT family transporter [Ardenticatenales bacterium]